MNTNFEFPTSGWLVDLSPSAQREIHRYFPKPKVPIEDISRAAGYYKIKRDAKNPTPDEARKLLKRLNKQARDLRCTLERSAIRPIESFMMQTACIIDVPEVNLADLESTLFYLERICAATTDLILVGRRRSPRDKLVTEMVHILRKADVVVDAKPKGTLCILVDIILRDVGEIPGDLPKLVRPVLQALETSK